MQRRHFLQNSLIAVTGSTIFSNKGLAASSDMARQFGKQIKMAKNIIFMVSDGMSTGTLNMADLLLQSKFGRRSHWLDLYDQKLVNRALMDTASASSLVTDSAAASSAWGGGVRVKNGSINVGENGALYQPILQKFKAAGKSVGCVTTVPVAHATPAGFCVNNNKRGDMDEIAQQYLPLQFDCMMGGGADNFLATGRRDKTDLLNQYQAKGYDIVQDRSALMESNSDKIKPLLGLFHSGGLPYSLDQTQDKSLMTTIPTLAEMTHKAIQHMKKNRKGFVLQVEAGKVDWAAHANDIGGLLYDQIAFDEAIKVAIDFAKNDAETLVIITTDHGNANPGLFYGDKANQHFDAIQSFVQTNEWILNGISKSDSISKVIERVAFAQKIVLQKTEAEELLKHYEFLSDDGLYNARKLPFKKLAQIQSNYTSVGWGSMDHSADYVELCMYGPGSELLPPFVKNTDLHDFMLYATAIKQ